MIRDQARDDVAFMDGPTALPRDNGEIIFSAPWEARAFALAVAVVDRLDLPWDAFRSRLIDEIAAVARPPVLRELGRRLGVAPAQPRAHHS